MVVVDILFPVLNLCFSSTMVGYFKVSFNLSLQPSLTFFENFSILDLALSGVKG